ncbi:MAG: glycosyl transferase family 1, partial [Armatimonadetes bacterium]|nr:glycosyl transferase family 1 [Armatimonadota bacterium]NIO98624.1 glycosyl transferase family 1 [Armatimonadota bacterium]
AKPVVAGRAGGIPMQFPERYQDYLVDDVEGCAKGISELLESAEKRNAFGEAGKEKIRQEFLLPRLIRDELKLIRDLLDGRPT